MYRVNKTSFTPVWTQSFMRQQAGKLHETGEGAGAGYNINVPLPPGDDELREGTLSR